MVEHKAGSGIAYPEEVRPNTAPAKKHTLDHVPVAITVESGYLPAAAPCLAEPENAGEGVIAQVNMTPCV